MNARKSVGKLWVGVDIGGTFTDIVGLTSEGHILTEKVLSSVHDYSEAIALGVAQMLKRAELEAASVQEVVHATTVATNAILERKGARTGLITTAGFRDVLDIRHSRRPDMYNISWEKPPALVDRCLRLEARERVSSQGEVVTPLDSESARQAIAILKSEKVESVAICLINSFANAAHEQAIAALLRKEMPNVSISVSSEVLPEAKEYERTSTTCINAYVRPVMERYLNNLVDRLSADGIKAPLLTMQSNGGIMSAKSAAQKPIHIVESGPAAGVIGAARLAKEIGCSKAIAFDMGGTTAKAALIENGNINLTVNLEVGAGLSAVSRLNKGGGYALSTPSVDIAEVGIGGGSIAWLDESKALRVGPHSAGAKPGPACYALGGERPTITDANLLLGYLNPDYLVGGNLRLDRSRAEAAYKNNVAAALGVSIEEAAFGVRSVANAAMARGIRAVSTERGHDPRDAVLIAFGGNGPVHAADLARELGMSQVVIPATPGVFSAFGLLQASIEHGYSRTCMSIFSAENEDLYNSHLRALKAGAEKDIREAGYQQTAREWALQADLRYRSQASQLIINCPSADFDASSIGKMGAAFESEHKRIFGYSSPNEKIEIINIRLTARLEAVRPAVGTLTKREAPLSGSATRSAYFGPKYGMLEAQVFSRDTVGSREVVGPAIIEQYDTTIVIPPDAVVKADLQGNLIIDLKAIERADAVNSEQYDAATREIIRHALESLADEMALTIVRTCRSGHVKHSGDFSTAIADGSGQLLAQGVTSPFHLGAMPDALTAIMRDYSERITDGDVFVLNDPFNGGMHLPDVFIIKPIFADAKLAAFATTIVHQVDIGGRVAGGNSTLNTEVFAEGIRLPIMKIYDAGKPVAAIFDMISANVRVPEMVLGDIRAQLSACTRGEADYQALATRYGPKNLKRFQDEILDATEVLARETIRSIPDGLYEFEDFLDGDSIDPEPVCLRAAMTIRGDEVFVDCEGSSKQVRGAINCTLSVTKSMAYTALRCLMPAHASSNAGYMRPIHLTAPIGSVLNPVMPAASGGRAVTGYRFMDVMFGALAKAVPGRIMACGDGAPIVVSFDGLDTSKKRFVLVDLLRGSWGGRPSADGLDGTTLACSTGSSIPAEIVELEHPVRVEFCGYLPDTGGPGRFRGGLAVVRDFRLLAESAAFQFRSERRKYRPWGLEGGEAGSVSAIVLDPYGKSELLSEKGEIKLKSGQVVRTIQSGGGGYGHPFDRAIETVLADVRNGLVSFTGAADSYGVVIDPRTRQLDEEATRRTRANRPTAQYPSKGQVNVVVADQADVKLIVDRARQLTSSHA